MQNKIGTTAYVENLNSVRQDILGKRHERKLKRSVEFVTNPERAARKKIRQHEKACTLHKCANEQAKETRKKKIEGFKSRRVVYGR